MKARIVAVLIALLPGSALVKAQAPVAAPQPGPAPMAAPAGPPAAPASTAPIYPGPPIIETGGPTYLPEAAGPPDCAHPLWVSADYLLWTVRHQTLPGVAASTPMALGVDLSAAGGSRMTPVFLAASADGIDINTGDHSGFRIGLGYWFDPQQCCGVEANFMYLERTGGVFSNASNNSPQFTINAVSSGAAVIAPGAAPAAALILANASANVYASTTNSLWGGEVNGRWTSVQFGTMTFGGLAGFRYVGFDESLNLQDSALLSLATAGSPTVVQNTTDSIRARNNFYGGQLGTDVTWFCKGVFLDLRGKVGLGMTHESVDLGGATTMTLNGVSTTLPGGALTGAGTLGTHNRNRIAWTYELNLKLGYEVTNWFSIYVGYDYLDLSNVVRSTGVTGVSQTNVTATVAGTGTAVTLSQPTFRFTDSNLWLQGFNFGFALHY
jgi:hypothetical protein